jgi:hypothetical protein
MPLTAYVLGPIPDERHGVAGGILSVGREVSGAFGIAVIGLIIAARQHSEVASGATHAAAFQHATSIGLLCGAGLVCVGALIALVTLPPRKLRARHARPQWSGTADTHVTPEPPPLLTWTPTEETVLTTPTAPTAPEPAPLPASTPPAETTAALERPQPPAWSPPADTPGRTPLLTWSPPAESTR